MNGVLTSSTQKHTVGLTTSSVESDMPVMLFLSTNFNTILSEMNPTRLGRCSNYIHSFRSHSQPPQCVSKHSTFHHNFGKSRPIYKIFIVRFLRQFCTVRKYHKDSPPHLKYVSTLPCETWKLQLLPISMAYARETSEFIL